jgi:DNA-binding transcriptional MocR family regulator
MKNTIFAFKDDSPKYKQIYEQFKLFIERGDIPAGDSLPSIRQLKVYPTSIYFIKNHSDEAIIKLGFSNLSCEEIQLGVELLKKAWT